ncbi:MAG TPA: Gfo/Idh/MocA family oxidoreductase [Thermomicrobiaceae bacterium]|nr:Gfo/Idh/MocA family oxidoreductase [Thermomicrobiaceae bacterium]
MPERPRLAVVGCGYWGSKHIRVAAECATVEMALAVDSRIERLEYVRSMYPGVATSPSLAVALDDERIDGIVLATPISTHYDLARAALLAGKHVLVEKPLATTEDEARDLLDLADRQDRVLMVGHTFEYHPAVAYLRDLVASGELGDIHYVDSVRLNLGLFQRDANVLWDLAPHDLSIIFFILGRQPRTISAWGHSHIVPDIEDVAFANLTFGDGISAHLHVSWLDPCKVRRVTVAGSRAMAVFDDVALTEKVRIYDKRFSFAPTGDRYADFQAGYHYGNVVIPPISTAEPLALECADFAQAIATGRGVRADGSSGLRVVAALEAASRSLAHLGRVEPLTHESELAPMLAGASLDDRWAGYAAE